MAENWVTLDTVQGRLEAEIIRGMLQAQEIEVQLSQESTASVYGLGVGPMAEVELYVREHQLADAETLLNQYHDGSLVGDDLEEDDLQNSTETKN